MFKFIKIVLALVVLVIAGAFIYDKYCSMSECDEDGKCC
jgi:uncharacterized protein YneF (UPF0154 family)